jgi:hypothetical protein
VEGTKLKRTEQKIASTGGEYGEIQVDLWEDMETGRISVRVRKYNISDHGYPGKQGMIIVLPDPAHWDHVPEGGAYRHIEVK